MTLKRFLVDFVKITKINNIKIDQQGTKSNTVYLSH